MLAFIDIGFARHGAPLSIIFQLQLQLLQLVVVERFVAQPPAPVAQPLALATTAPASRGPCTERGLSAREDPPA